VRLPLLVLLSRCCIAGLILRTNQLKVREVILEGAIHLLHLIDGDSVHIRLLRQQIARHILPTAVIAYTLVQRVTKCL
jgi:hypothetical protein